MRALALAVALALTASALCLCSAPAARADAPRASQSRVAVPQPPVPPAEEILPVMHGWIGFDLAGGVCTRPGQEQPCASAGVVPEAAVTLMAVDTFDAHVALEWRLSLSLGLTDTIGSLRNNPLRTIGGLTGEVGLRWTIFPRDGWFLVAGVRAGFQALSERFVSYVFDPTTRSAIATSSSGLLETRIGGAIGAGWYLDGARHIDLSVRAVLDTGSIGARVSLSFRLD